MDALDPDQAETLALNALAYLAGDEDALTGFLAATGLSPDDLRSGAGDPHILAGVMDYLLADEQRLLAFCAEAGIEETLPARARASLPGGRETHWT